MSEYELTSAHFEGELMFEYALNGYLTKFVNSANLNEKQLAFLFGNFPTTEAALVAFVAPTTMTARKIIREVSFEMFWEKYDKKVDRIRAERVWERLSKAKKILAFDAVGAYNYYLTVKKQAKAYPTTYLNNEYWSTDWKAESRK